jgi:succinate dehydrogenase / fumarate reductase cytochrome b subunit
LSPHLQIYRWPITMVASIAHRATGMALAAGTLLLSWWLIAAASGPEAYAVFARVAANPVGEIVLFGFLWSLAFHLLNGIRHRLGHRLWLSCADGEVDALVFVGSLLLAVGASPSASWSRQGWRMTVRDFRTPCPSRGPGRRQSRHAAFLASAHDGGCARSALLWFVAWRRLVGAEQGANAHFAEPVNAALMLLLCPREHPSRRSASDHHRGLFPPRARRSHLMLNRRPICNRRGIRACAYQDGARRTLI